MEPSAILLNMVPILFPIATQLGVDPIHLGIIMVVNMEIGMITPPVGLNLFVAAGNTGRSMGWAIRAALPWLAILLAILVIVTYVPEISLTLPNLIDQWRGIQNIGRAPNLGGGTTRPRRPSSRSVERCEPDSRRVAASA